MQLAFLTTIRIGPQISVCNAHCSFANLHSSMTTSLHNLKMVKAAEGTNLGEVSELERVSLHRLGHVGDILQRHGSHSL